MLVEVPVQPGDVVLDLGSGLGKVVLLTHLLTGARAHGVELQPALVSRARDAASAHGLDVTFEQGDAREADLGDANVFFLYLPFTGPALARVLDRLKAVASRRAIVVATLGVDLDRVAPWLVRRPVDSFWLALYDGAPSARPGTPDRPVHRSPLLTYAADLVAFERRLPTGSVLSLRRNLREVRLIPLSQKGTPRKHVGGIMGHFLLNLGQHEVAPRFCSSCGRSWKRPLALRNGGPHRRPLGELRGQLQRGNVERGGVQRRG